MKNKPFWNYLIFYYSANPTTNTAIRSPQSTRSTKGDAEIWEGLCGKCDKWVALVRSKKRDCTLWFEHVYEVSDTVYLPRRGVISALCDID